MEFLNKFNPLTAEYRKKEPLSIKTIKGATALTPLDSVVEISKELKKEEPDYKKIGLLTAMEMAGTAAPMAKPALTAIKAGKKGSTVKAYKLFTKGEDGKLYPLFVDADAEVPIGTNLKATFPEYRFQAENGNFYVPSRGTAGAKGTGDSIKIPDQETRDMLIAAGFLPKGSKAKTVKAVAARPGWHAGDNPTAPHIGPEFEINGETFKVRGDNQVWAEVEMPDNVDWQSIANSRASIVKSGKNKGKLNVKTAHITDELPFDGYYRYKTNPNMEGNWLISGDMKVIRELPREEVLELNRKAGVEDLPTLAEVREAMSRSFAAGGIVGENMYKGMDDYLMSEMTGMSAGGMADVPDNTIGIDPVSGNEIPMGSTAENVRDDIPSMLSEGEIVVPADVVNYHGVKLFEELRAQAKMGYQQMDQDGRIGGEPIEEPPVMGADIDIDLSMEDLEATDTMGAEEPVEAFFGLFTGGSKKEKDKQSVRDRFKAAEERKSVDKIKSGKTKTKPKTAAEKMAERMKRLFPKDDDRKRPSKPSKPEKSGAKLDLGFSGNPMERAARKYDTGTTPKKEAGKVEEAYTGQNLRGDKGFGERFMAGLGFDEGGMAADETFAQKGGFDMDAEGVMSTPTLEMREYMNDVGHRIFITFINGEPQMAIPEGYFPVGEAQAQKPPVEEAQPASGGGGGGSGGSSQPKPEPFDYKALSMDDLQEEVTNVIKPSITIIDKIGKSIHSKFLIKEIDRRLATEGIPIYEKEYLENLKTNVENPEPSLLEKGLAKITGQELTNNNPNLTGPTYDMLPNQYGVVEAYTPETQKGSDTVKIPTQPNVETEPLVPGTGKTLDEILAQDPSSSAMNDLQDLADELSKPQVRGNTRLEKDAQRRRDRQEANKNLRGSTARKTGQAKSATRGLGTTDKKGGAALDSRFGISGLEKGGLASKKGKKKKSK